MDDIDDALRQTLDMIDAEYARLGPTQMDEDWARLTPPTEEELAALEQRLGRELGDQLRRFLRANTTRHSFSGNFECLDAAGIEREWTTMTTLLEDGTFDGWVAERRRSGNWDDGQLAEVWWSRAWIPFAVDSCGNMMCVDLEPGTSGFTGQIVNMEVQDGQGPFATGHDSLGSYLAAHLQHLRDGRVHVVDEFLEVDRYAPLQTRPVSDGVEHLAVYMLDDVPDALTRLLPEASDPRGCLFWTARLKSPTVRRLLDEIAEPQCDSVDEAMELAGQLGTILAQNRRLAELLRPTEVAEHEPSYGGTYSVGFHTAPAPVVRELLETLECRLHDLDELLDPLHVLLVTNADGSPAQDVRVTVGPSARHVVRASVGSGLYVIEQALPFAGPFVLSNDAGRAELPTLGTSGVCEVTLIAP